MLKAQATNMLYIFAISFSSAISLSMSISQKLAAFKKQHIVESVTQNLVQTVF